MACNGLVWPVWARGCIYPCWRISGLYGAFLCVHGHGQTGGERAMQGTSAGNSAGNYAGGYRRISGEVAAKRIAYEARDEARDEARERGDEQGEYGHDGAGGSARALVYTVVYRCTRGVYGFSQVYTHLKALYFNAYRHMVYTVHTILL